MATPTQTIIINAILNNSGLTVSRDLITAVDNFNNAPVTKAVQDLLAQSNITTDVRTALLDAPNFITGMSPEYITSTSDNLISELLTQANLIFGGSVQSFAYTYASVSSFVSSSYETYGSMSNAIISSFNDYGFLVSNYTDLLSVGVTSQFDEETLTMLVNELDNLGTMFDVTDLQNMSHPASVLANLVYQGLGKTSELTDKLYAFGATNMTFAGLKDIKRDVLLAIMNSVVGAELTEMLEVTGYTANTELVSLLQVMDINNVFSTELVAKVTSLDTLATKLSNIGGTFETIADLKEFYGGVVVSNFERLNALDYPAPEELFSDYRGILGAGTGVFENPTFTDVIGTVAGAGYVDDINTCVAQQDYLITCSAPLAAFQTLIETHVAAGTMPDLTELTTAIYNLNTDVINAEHLTSGGDAFVNIATRFQQELDNLSIAGITLGETGAANSLITLSNEIAQFGNDPKGLHAVEIFKGMATDDVYGDALLAAINEANNLHLAQKFRIPTLNQIQF